jgi:predicted nucleotide-binding protein
MSTLCRTLGEDHFDTSVFYSTTEDLLVDTQPDFDDQFRERRILVLRKAVVALNHVSTLMKAEVDVSQEGTLIFIGHGRSPAWKDLRDFLKDRLHLAVDEFNRMPPAGMTTVERLEEMLDSARLAFLVMTAEDEDNEGKARARQNVVHEVGLFQGRLGFRKAIVLLEEGCEEFSNIAGLSQVRFPKGNMSATFEEIRRVLEREGLIPGTGAAF